MRVRSGDGGENWSAPVRVAEGDLSVPHRGNDVQVAAAGRRCLAAWQVPGTGYKGRGPVATALSEDGGRTWTAQVHLIKSLNGIYFVDSEYGWAVGNEGNILHTTDGGKQWLKQQSLKKTDLFGVFFTDRQEGWAVGMGGTILHTTDGGETWKPEKSVTTQDLWAIQFVGKSYGWIVGQGGVVLHFSKNKT